MSARENQENQSSASSSQISNVGENQKRPGPCFPSQSKYVSKAGSMCRSSSAPRSPMVPMDVLSSVNTNKILSYPYLLRHFCSPTLAAFKTVLFKCFKGIMHSHIQVSLSRQSVEELLYMTLIPRNKTVVLQNLFILVVLFDDPKIKDYRLHRIYFNGLSK